MRDSELKAILDKGLSEKKLSTEEISYLLSVKDERSIEDIFDCARTIKQKHYGNKVFLYGFVYFSTYCRNNCTFCYYRKDNTLPRYRKTTEEIVSLSENLVDSGVNLIDLTMGEDPLFRANGFEKLIDAVQSVRGAVDTPIMVSPGVMPENMFPVIRDAGADWFACYQETHNRGLFNSLRIGQDYDFRSMQKVWAVKSGLLAEEGIMTGIGETIEDRAVSISNMVNPDIRQVRAMTFVPQDGAPLVGKPGHTAMDEILTIAVLRITNPDKFIPASMDVEGSEGLVARVNAGANIITSIVPPKVSLAGVAQHDLDIDNGNRSVENISELLDGIGSKCGTKSDYNSIIHKWRHTQGA